MHVIRNYPSVPFGDDLRHCVEQGIMYQDDISSLIDYDESYFQHYLDIKGSEIAKRLNAARTGITEKYCRCLLDIGIGSGEFIGLSKSKVFGFDINPFAVRWLKEEGLFVDLYGDHPEGIEGFTLWDTLEHVPEPQLLFQQIPSNRFVFVSLPIFEDLNKVRASKHFKPNEHLYYFERRGLVTFMTDSGFEFIAHNDDETKAGRESIETFVFRKK
jgi:hypothetical protein